MPQLYNYDGLLVKEALGRYFDLYHFKDGGYNNKWFSIKLGGFHIYLPNIKARVDAVKIHDIHHLITGYHADLKGEAEIGAWELARGCGKYWASWLLNLGSFFIGVVLCPRRLYKAFVNGRSSATNLYYNIEYSEALLANTVTELKTKISYGERKSGKWDFFLFVSYLFITIGVPLLAIVDCLYRLK